MLNLGFNAVFLGASEVAYVRKSDGQPSKYYNVSVKSGAECMTLPCTDSVYRAYTSGILKDFQTADFCAQYQDGKYARLTVTDVIMKK